jgi:hypothetical protein
MRRIYIMKWIIATVTVLMLAGCGSGVEWFPESTGGSAAPTFSGTFTNVNAATISTPYPSNQLTITNTTGSWAISVVGGTYSINGGAPTSAGGTISANQSVALQQTSSSSTNTPTTVTLTVGTSILTWTVTTAPPTV